MRLPFSLSQYYTIKKAEKQIIHKKNSGVYTPEPKHPISSVVPPPFDAIQMHESTLPDLLQPRKSIRHFSKSQSYRRHNLAFPIAMQNMPLFDTIGMLCYRHHGYTHHILDTIHRVLRLHTTCARPNIQRNDHWHHTTLHKNLLSGIHY